MYDEGASSITTSTSVSSDKYQSDESEMIDKSLSEMNPFANA